MIEILKPFGVGQYQSSIGFWRFGAARFGAGFAARLVFFADRFAALAMLPSGFLRRRRPRLPAARAQPARVTPLRKVVFGYSSRRSSPGRLLQPKGETMLRTIFAAALAAGLLAAPSFTTGAAAQNAPAASNSKNDTATKTKPPASAAVQAMRQRQKKCGAEWKAAKAAGKIEKGTTWPKYWSACNKRLKAGG
jgi:hypothetical protein